MGDFFNDRLLSEVDEVAVAKFLRQIPRGFLGVNIDETPGKDLMSKLGIDMEVGICFEHMSLAFSSCGTSWSGFVSSDSAVFADLHQHGADGDIVGVSRMIDISAVWIQTSQFLRLACIVSKVGEFSTFVTTILRHHDCCMHGFPIQELSIARMDVRAVRVPCSRSAGPGRGGPWSLFARFSSSRMMVT